MSEFLWHKVSEKEKEDIRKQAKRIMDSFSKKLDKVKAKVGESYIERSEFERKEKQGKSQDLDRGILFENAPEKNNDFIIGGKKLWE